MFQIHNDEQYKGENVRTELDTETIKANGYWLFDRNDYLIKLHEACLNRQGKLLVNTFKPAGFRIARWDSPLAIYKWMSNA